VDIIREVIYDKLPIDTAVLCNVIEHICGILIVLHKYRTRGTLHNVVLPRRWLLVLLKDFQEGLKRFEEDIINTWFLRRFLQPLAALLRQIYSKPRPGQLTLGINGSMLLLTHDFFFQNYTTVYSFLACKLYVNEWCHVLFNGITIQL
jgi:hypothetical protein